MVVLSYRFKTYVTLFRRKYRLHYYVSNKNAIRSDMPLIDEPEKMYEAPVFFFSI